MNAQSHLDKYYKVENKAKLEELILDQLRIPELKESDTKLFEGYTGVTLFSMNACGLKSLNNLPAFPLLETLDLNDNKLQGEELSKILIYKKLNKLRMSNNPIKSLDEIKILAALEELEILDLVDCPINEVQNYKEEVFKILPKLQVLDMQYKDGRFYESEDDFEEEDEDEMEENEDDFIEEEEEGEEEDEEEEEGEDDKDTKPVKKQKTEK